MTECPGAIYVAITLAVALPGAAAAIWDGHHGASVGIVTALSDYPAFVPVVARWNWQEWGHTDPGGTLAAWTAGLARQALCCRGHIHDPDRAISAGPGMWDPA